jgi:2-polyprenyl-6-methoxyphenol hydroxylase-like FAD-dependent oxidoreductase
VRILISGAGIAGLSAGYWLAKSGAQVVIVEKACRLDDAGYGINLVGGSLGVLDAMGILGTLERLRLPVTAHHLMGRDGGVVRSLDISEFNSPGAGLFLRRSDLQQALVGALGRSVELRLSTTIVELSGQEHGVRARFANGGDELFDMVVGADGLHSGVRPLAFGHVTAHSLEVLCFAFTVRGDFESAWGAHTLTAPGRAATITRLSEREWTGLFWVRAPDAELPDRSAGTAYLAQRFGDFGWIVRDIVDAIDERRGVYADVAAQIRMPTWHRGRVVLLGDAAHCLSPLATRGAGAALLGGRQLADSLHTSSRLDEAFAHYESCLRARIDRVQQVAVRNAEMMLPRNDETLQMQFGFLRSMPDSAMRDVMRQQFADGL